MGCRSTIGCGNCGRIFLEQWRYDRHICKEEMSLVDRFREWRRYRNTTETEKFISDLKHADTGLSVQVANAYEQWKKGRTLV